MTTPQGLAVSAAHDAAQAHLLDRALAEVALVFESLLDVTDLDGSSRLYLPVAQDSLLRYRAQATSVAQDFYVALREVETAGKVAPFVPETPPPPVDALLNASLRVVGPVTAKSGIANGLRADEAMAAALKATLGAATRHVEGGPRDLNRLAVVRDPAAGGWARRSGGSPCAFCAMLISRGPVYSEGTGSFRSHDHCHCKAVPFFGADTGWTQQSADLASLWRSSGGTLKDFSRAYRARAASQAEALPLAA